MIVAFLLLALAGSVQAADPPRLPDGITCDHVRQMVAEHGEIKAIAMALRAGASWNQIRLARRCLRR